MQEQLHVDGYGERDSASLDKDCIIDLVAEKSALVTHADSIKDINKQFIIILFYSILFVTALGLRRCLSVCVFLPPAVPVPSEAVPAIRST